MGESFKMNENKTLNQEKHQDQERYTTMNMLSINTENQIPRAENLNTKKNKYIEREKGWKKEIKIKRYEENRITGGKCRTKEVNKRKIKNVQTEDR